MIWINYALVWWNCDWLNDKIVIGKVIDCIEKSVNWLLYDLRWIVMNYDWLWWNMKRWVVFVIVIKWDIDWFVVLRIVIVMMKRDCELWYWNELWDCDEMRMWILRWNVKCVEKWNGDLKCVCEWKGWLLGIVGLCDRESWAGRIATRMWEMARLSQADSLVGGHL